MLSRKMGQHRIEFSKRLRTVSTGDTEVWTTGMNLKRMPHHDAPFRRTVYTKLTVNHHIAVKAPPPNCHARACTCAHGVNVTYGCIINLT